MGVCIYFYFTYLRTRHRSGSREEARYAEERRKSYDTTQSSSLPGVRSEFSSRHNLSLNSHMRDKVSADTDGYAKEKSSSLYDFEVHKNKLARIFFRNEDLIQYGTTEYYDFWKFLKGGELKKG